MAINQIRPDTPLANTPEPRFVSDTIKPKKPFNQWTEAEKQTHKDYVYKKAGKASEGAATYKVFKDSVNASARNEREAARVAKEEAFKKMLKSGIKEKSFQNWTTEEKAKHKAETVSKPGGKEKYATFKDSISKDVKKRNTEQLFKITAQQGFGSDTTAYKKYQTKQDRKNRNVNDTYSLSEGTMVNEANKRTKGKGSCTTGDKSKGQCLKDNK